MRDDAGLTGMYFQSTANCRARRNPEYEYCEVRDVRPFSVRARGEGIHSARIEIGERDRAQKRRCVRFDVIAIVLIGRRRQPTRTPQTMFATESPRSKDAPQLLRGPKNGTARDPDVIYLIATSHLNPASSQSALTGFGSKCRIAGIAISHFSDLYFRVQENAERSFRHFKGVDLRATPHCERYFP